MKSIFEQNGGTYTKVGDYYIPNIAVPNTKEYNIGKYGRLRRTFLKEHHNWLYSTMLMEGTLLEHLAEIDETCYSTMDNLIKAMAKQEGVTEQLKAVDQMVWVQRMNNIRSRAEEIVLNDYVYGGFER
ncbi:MAG: TnpV protein [Clostridia bacterium]|nr:TnpV protein [Clostridia bacterium]